MGDLSQVIGHLRGVHGLEVHCARHTRLAWTYSLCALTNEGNIKNVSTPTKLCGIISMLVTTIPWTQLCQTNGPRLGNLLKIPRTGDGLVQGDSGEMECAFMLLHTCSRNQGDVVRKPRLSNSCSIDTPSLKHSELDKRYIVYPQRIQMHTMPLILIQ